MDDLPEPRSSRPPFPPVYRLASDLEGTIAWSETVARLRESRSYWIATSGPEGAPHVVPVWGLWLEDGLHFGTASATRMGRNLANDDRAVVHLESADDVVILKGRVAPHRIDDRVADASAAKYGHRPDPDAESAEGTFRFRPRIGYAWRVSQLSRTATRYDFRS